MPLPDQSVTLDRTWTDEDGEPLGGWLETSHEELQRIVADAGGLDALTVFSTYTNPPWEVYTAWGQSDDDAPLVDIRTLDWHKPAPPRREVYRKFVKRKNAS